MKSHYEIWAYEGRVNSETKKISGQIVVINHHLLFQFEVRLVENEVLLISNQHSYGLLVLDLLGWWNSQPEIEKNTDGLYNFFINIIA